MMRTDITGAVRPGDDHAELTRNSAMFGKRGLWETEFSYGGEADLHEHVKNCSKNPGHLQFIPVDQFNADHLPIEYHDNDLVDFIRAVSDLTVRVSVQYVSKSRPGTFPRSAATKGKKVMKVGSGWIRYVNKYSYTDNKETCDCRECYNSCTPKTEFAHVQILTAAHLVRNEMAGPYTTCHLFLDEGNTPDSCSHVVTLSGMSHVYTDTGSDWCHMRYVTHNLSLIERIHQAWCRSFDLYKKIWSKYCQLEADSRGRQLDARHKVSEQPLVIIVSHPHGCRKQVSLGQVVNTVYCHKSISQYTYTTATCPGSSGAPVFVLGRYNLNFDHVHCGNCDPTNGVNFSSPGYEMK